MDDLPLAYRTAGDGAPLLLVHGAAEDAAMLTPQAEAFAAHGRRVVWYDRRGTGASTRDGWPHGGVAQHADDAAALLRTLDAAPATVLGFSSGGVVAMALAARHPDVVTDVIAWEPPAVAMLPDGAALHAGFLSPIEAHLADHPKEWEGAFTVMLDVLSDGHADPDSPVARAQLVNAEAAVRDDARIITAHVFSPGDLRGDSVTIAVGTAVSPVLAAIADALVAELDHPALVVDDADEHEIYLTRPEVLATALSGVGAQRTAGASS